LEEKIFKLYGKAVVWNSFAADLKKVSNYTILKILIKKLINLVANHISYNMSRGVTLYLIKHVAL
jgi:hypothetical protein